MESTDISRSEVCIALCEVIQNFHQSRPLNIETQNMALQHSIDIVIQHGINSTAALIRISDPKQGEDRPDFSALRINH